MRAVLTRTALTACGKAWLIRFVWGEKIVGSNPTSQIMNEFQKTNRQKKQTPKLGMGWCGGCDKDIVPHTNGKKCPVCGYINGIKRFKKDK